MSKFLLALGISILSAIPAISAPARAPLGFPAFCARNPDDCEPTGTHDPMVMDAKRWAEITSVNRSVNSSIRYRRDGTRRDVWSVVEGRGTGDCEDYALTKRRRLIELGWPSSALLITTVRTRTGQGHAVLTVRTDAGDFILDNLAWSVRRVERTGYRFYSMQSPGDPRKWVRVTA